MGLLNRIRDAVVDDSAFFAAAAKEIESGRMRDGLWAKALTEANFDEQKARAIYMRMVVKVMQREGRIREDQDAAKEREAMKYAIVLYDQGKYGEALEGLLALYGRGDRLAAACLGNIAWHGLIPTTQDREVAQEFLTHAEQSSDAHVRRYVGIVYESINWQKSLENYDFAASKGCSDAASRASALRRRLKDQGLLPRGFLDKLFG